jgi:NADPH:quinone reductase-like Zn-dependent oxidoreductase
MHALVVPNKNNHSLTELEWQTVANPTPVADEVLVQTKAVGLNPVDYKVIESGNDNWQFPHVIGLDVAGVVEQVGSAVTKFKAGDRVAGHGDLSRAGVFAEQAIAKADALALIPTNVDFTLAAGSLCAGLTAYQSLYRKANPNAAVKTVLVQGGAGGVGTMAIQLAKLAGKRVITTVSYDKMEFVSTLKPDDIIDYRHENVTERIFELTDDQGVDVSINVAGDADEAVKQLAYNGQLICIENGPTKPLAWDKALTYAKIDLGGAHRSNNPAQVRDLGQMAMELLNLVDTDGIDPQITEIISAHEIVNGLQKIKSHQVLGKIVATF